MTVPVLSSDLRPDPTGEMLRLVRSERQRQDRLVASGVFSETCASRTMSAALKFVVLGEEVGEVAAAVLGLDPHDSHAGSVEELRDELIQVAAVAVAWAESL